jgi:hypothetical protein
VKTSSRPGTKAGAKHATWARHAGGGAFCEASGQKVATSGNMPSPFSGCTFRATLPGAVLGLLNFGERLRTSISKKEVLRQYPVTIVLFNVLL